MDKKRTSNPKETKNDKYTCPNMYTITMDLVKVGLALVLL